MPYIVQGSMNKNMFRPIKIALHNLSQRGTDNLPALSRLRFLNIHI